MRLGYKIEKIFQLHYFLIASTSGRAGMEGANKMTSLNADEVQALAGVKSRFTVTDIHIRKTEFKTEEVCFPFRIK